MSNTIILTCTSHRDHRNKVACVKLIRQMTASSLLDAKTLVERAENGETVKINQTIPLYTSPQYPSTTPANNPFSTFETAGSRLISADQICIAINAMGYNATTNNSKLHEILLTAVQEAIATRRYNVAARLLDEVHNLEGN
jgi:hypothetical protein